MAGGQVLLGMSGGVDSSAAAVLLQEAGYEVVGCTLLMQDSGKARRDAADAAAAAARLGMTFCTVDCTERFRRRVEAPFAAAYAAGRTPNPCVLCNRDVKFPALLEQADAMGIETIATGHYARVRWDGTAGRWQLLRGADRRKDQSYFLYPLSQEILGRLVLPLGAYEKERARALAERAGLPNAGRADSQDICFVPGGDYLAYLTGPGGLSPREGEFVDRRGRVLGRHRGQEGYTIGQRRGLGVSAGQPLYVVEKDPVSGRVVLGGEEELFSEGLVAGAFQWVSVPPPAGPTVVEARIRHSPRAAAAEVSIRPDGAAEVRFRQPQRAVTPGQSVVLYQGDLVLGGGVIERTL